jgi:hypothetical protein
MVTSFSIKDLAQLTRIKPHTLRIWEQRYGILKPQRSDSNIRRYNQEELKYLLNVAILYENGFKISQIAKLTNELLTSEVIKATASEAGHISHIQGLVIAMLELDEVRFDQQLTNNITTFGMEETITQIVYPFLQHIGILWQTNTINPAQEHFITYLIRQKLIVAIDEIGSQPKKTEFKKFILYLPEGELHELSLLFTCYLVKLSGHKCIYLGQSLPLGDLAEVQAIHKADYIFTIITSTPCLEDVEPYLLNMNQLLPDVTIWVTGYQIFSQSINLPSNIVAISNPTELRQKLADC